MTMPRIWWSPSEGLLKFLHGKWWPAGDRFDGATWDVLPDDAVELLPVVETYWEIAFEDFGVITTFDNESAAKEWIASRTKYRNPRLRRASVSRSEWQEVDE